MLTIDFTILNKNWVIKILSKNKYVKKHGRDSVAMCLMYKRTIVVHPSGIDLSTIKHELVHAYLYEMCIKSTEEITANDMEEIFAEFFGNRGREALDLADRLYSEILNITGPAITNIKKDEES